MAKIEIVTLTDSLDERVSTGVETVVFYHPVFGTKHEIELSEKNREHFANHLAKLDKYFEASRLVEDAKPEPKATAAKSDLSKVREWAKLNGYEVGDRGRIKAEIVKAYNTALVLGEPETQKELDEQDNDSVSVVDETDLVEVEFPQDEDSNTEQRELSDEEILNLMSELDKTGEDVTLEKLAESANS